MKIELKSIKHAAFSSEETECFSAVIYVAGVKAGSVSNAGHGGPNCTRPYGLEKQINEYAASLPPLDISHLSNDGGMHTIAQNCETLIGDLLTKYLTDKALKRRCSKDVLFRVESHSYAEGEYHIVKGKYSPEIKDALVKRHGVAVAILNEKFT